MGFWSGFERNMFGLFFAGRTLTIVPERLVGVVIDCWIGVVSLVAVVVVAVVGVWPVCCKLLFLRIDVMVVGVTKVTCCVDLTDVLSLMSPVGVRFLDVLVSVVEGLSLSDDVDLSGIQLSRFFQGAPKRQ